MKVTQVIQVTQVTKTGSIVSSHAAQDSFNPAFNGSQHTPQAPQIHHAGKKGQLLRLTASLVLGFSTLWSGHMVFALSPLHQPEGASGYQNKSSKSTRQSSIASANPLATEAGLQMLKAGGSAIDAAIATQMVLGLVEPQSSGIGGGAFLLYLDAQKKCTKAQSTTPCGLKAYDGRETAPAAVSEQLFIGADGKPMPFIDAVVGGRAVGTLGNVKMLELAHRKHGKLPWQTLFKPAIDLATNGFAVSPRLNTLLQNEAHLKKDPVALAYFYDTQGAPWPVGHVLKNPEYAYVLQRIAKEGAKALMEGEIAKAIVDKVQSHPTNSGKLSLTDLANYQPKVREALCTDYGKQYQICGFPPPSSGAITVAQILGILAHTPAQQMSAKQAVAYSVMTSPHPDWLHYYLEASRLAFADRAQFIADPDFVQAPNGNWMHLLDDKYLATRASLIKEESMKTAKAGQPVATKTSFAPMPDQIERGTSHISVVDRFGNALAMTTTIEDAFGSRQMVNRDKGLSGGFLLNNQLTDFSFAPQDAEGKPIANRVEPGKRPRSSMAPTLVFRKVDGALVATLGSPGGALIIHYVTKTLYAMLNWNLSPQNAINLPNFGSLNGPSILEEKRFPESTIEALKARGHEIRETAMTSGLQGIQRTSIGLVGGADPRREGNVMGE